jgi:hypothetical protein
MATPPRRRLPAHLQPFIAGSRDPGGLSKEDRSPGAQDPKGSSGPFSFSPEIGTGEGKKGRKKRKEKVRSKEKEKARTFGAGKSKERSSNTSSKSSSKSS